MGETALEAVWSVASGRWLDAKPHALGSGLPRAPFQVMAVDQCAVHKSALKAVRSVASGRWPDAKPHASGSGLPRAPVQVMGVDQWSVHKSFRLI